MRTTDHLVCTDCWSLARTGDATSFDFHYSGAEADERLAECESGIADLTPEGGHLSFDKEGDGEEHSIDPCGCCGSRLHGERHRVTAVRPLN